MSQAPQLTGSNFADFVCEAYRYLMDCYRPGDKIFLFGFSRGAYVARALAGMIQQVCDPARPVCTLQKS